MWVGNRAKLLWPAGKVMFLAALIAAVSFTVEAEPSTNTDRVWPLSAGETASSTGESMAPVEVDVSELTSSSAPVRPADSLTAASSVDLDSPLIDDFVHLPIEIRDSTSASHLVVQTQSIINATQIVVPAGSRPVHLIEVVKETLQKNLALNAARQTPRITGTSVDEALSVFDPVGFAKVSYTRTHTPTAGLFSGDLTGQATIKRIQRNSFGLGSTSDGDPGLGVSRKLFTGTDVTLAMTMDRKDSNIGGFFQPFDQEYRTGGSFSLIHPLMQGSGTAVNLASVRIAYNNTRISELDLRQITLDTLSLAHQAYWALVFSRINLAINQQSLGLAADLLRENRIRFKYGDLIAVDVFEAEAGVKQRERDVIAAENDLQNSMDGIRELVALDRKQPDWQAPLIPLDPPVFTPIVVDEPLSQDVAMKKNPQIQAARFDIQNAQEGLLLAQDRFRPSLDAVASLSESGLGETLHEDHDELMSGDYPSGSIALQYEMPLYRRKERAGILSSNYQIAQAQFNLRSIEQQVIYDHRQAVRNVENLERQVEASRASVRAERDRLEKQKIGHEQGVTTSHDLLEVQDAFAKAQASEIRAIVDYYLALIELERIRGTLVDSLGVQLVPMATVK